MTQQETKEFILKLITTLVQKKCYIKGYGNLMRICDEQHNQVTNITRNQFDVLVVNKIVRREGLNYRLKYNYMSTKKQTNIDPSDYEIRATAMKLATQHSRNCHVGTLIKLADSIYKFLKGKIAVASND